MIGARRQRAQGPPHDKVPALQGVQRPPGRARVREPAGRRLAVLVGPEEVPAPGSRRPAAAFDRPAAAAAALSPGTAVLALKIVPNNL